ncbi:MAG: tRNA (adenosine(37)-N6)-threonylcarbamoyltransferase complex dimerization subunit type 1 TsaB [Tissierellia bacterium]|nr:tRNA (adenosine(37)-N6)-threonylcarbamoyltransferase complex dimerization subunit type 1 TsaB [Tissierellia bacterium]
MDGEKILGFDTVSSICSLCIYDGEFHNFETPSNFGHARELMPLMDRALREVGYKLRDMDAIVVGLGPGSFTGIRIGLATALGLARGAGLSCYGVNSLRSRSYGAIADIIVPMMDARRGNVYAASYGLYEKEPFNGAFSDYLEELRALNQDIVFIGEKLEAFKEEASPFRFVSPGPLAQGVIEAYLDGHDCKELAPIYLREVEAKRRLEEKNANTGN